MTNYQFLPAMGNDQSLRSGIQNMVKRLNVKRLTIKRLIISSHDSQAVDSLSGRLYLSIKIDHTFYSCRKKWIESILVFT